MAAKDLITSGRALQNIQAITDNSQNALLATLITAYSDAIEKYCRRRFVSTVYDELYNGNGDRRLLLREYPLQSVQSVRYRPVTVLKIINSNTASIQRATVQVTSTGIALTWVASGVTGTDASSTYASFPTLQGIADNINSLGNGWSAQAVGSATGDYGLFPSADLYVPSSYGDGTTTASQGALTARGNYAELKLHTYELQGYQWDPRGWLLRAIPYTDPELLHPEDLRWPVGIDNFRVQYTAGYSTIPEAIQEACALWVAIAYNQTLRDPSLLSQAIAGAIHHVWGLQNPLHPPPRVRALLAPYRRHTVSTIQG
ncbi:MAG TPA: hypothetical protein VN688_03110 [Gemmataceae bacterium]|nr:hypothetical protein [Gemmataceae bacterium]